MANKIEERMHTLRGLGNGAWLEYAKRARGDFTLVKTYGKRSYRVLNRLYLVVFHIVQSRMTGRSLEKCARAWMSSTLLSHRASFGRTKRPSAGPSATGRLICAHSADPSALLAGFDLISPKHLLSG